MIHPDFMYCRVHGSVPRSLVRTLDKRHYAFCPDAGVAAVTCEVFEDSSPAFTPAMRLSNVRDRLQAWADDAAMRLFRCLPQEEQRYKNLLDNYNHLIDELTVAINELASG